MSGRRADAGVPPPVGAGGAAGGLGAAASAALAKFATFATLAAFDAGGDWNEAAGEGRTAGAGGVFGGRALGPELAAGVKAGVGGRSDEGGNAGAPKAGVTGVDVVDLRAGEKGGTRGGMLVSIVGAAASSPRVPNGSLPGWGAATAAGVTGASTRGATGEGAIEGAEGAAGDLPEGGAGGRGDVDPAAGAVRDGAGREGTWGANGD